ncbi:cilia- and flagella-associated protein 36-like [Oppia nitens]|uniref:cilia- and flagella-associated protein 36-like n=1 Tax=Oppia nitens TaxID=1686743 RepID=UPI0023D9C9B0|nr:cilia- and flagella-associated protein 36-like [Oppia nitens]
MSDSSADDSWVLDSLVGFLCGPVWSVTIDAFVEDKSVVFEPNAESTEESETEFRAIFVAFKALVDRLLSSHMSDLGISAKQFDDALRRADGLLAAKLRRVLFEQIWAAEDFGIFVRFMTQRNIDLQLQALDVLAQKFGTIYDSFVPEGTTKEQLLDEQTVIREAMKRSLEEEAAAEGVGVGEGGDIVLNEDVLGERKRLESEKQKQQQKLEDAIEEAMTRQEDDTEVSKKDSELSVVLKEELSEEEEVVDTNLSNEEMRKRGEYLRKQRDQLIERKKQQRHQQMARLEAQEVREKRPKSARAMRSVVESGEEVTDDQSLAFRRSLAARLKAEVVEKKKSEK